ncbi:replication/maintenance protein RepL [Streptococcus mitis]|uniref:Replication/maintenance protein n=1 Tax=Streptococcus mitis TaxID=28037 RepID=A0A4U1KWM9_STRMT|nr:replication/maintenance protein RepL [Streptococcus mitis]TKD48702.1 replication/maintenance protein [Streptococcus mitis]
MDEKGKKKKIMTTRKKIKFSGTQKYINQDTGEIVEMNVTEIEERDANFHKVWLGHVIQSLDLIGNKKIHILTSIMDNLNKENQFLYTYSMIEKETGISRRTIADTMTALQESDFLKKVKNGHYEVNPDQIFKGGKKSRMDILLRYKNLSALTEDEED